MPGMNSGLNPASPILVSAFRSALLHQWADRRAHLRRAAARLGRDTRLRFDAGAKARAA